MTHRDTIAAIATAPGRGGIGIVRVSGHGLQPFIRALMRDAVSPRRATLRPFFDARGELIDQGIALYFPAPNSYTGEDVVELQAHGGPLVLQHLLQRCVELGARVAEPGEFTRRAYLNGKLDLAQAEGVIDLIDATTTQALRCAVRSLQGAFSREITRLTDGMIGLRMLVEAEIDFPEEDLGSASWPRVGDALGALRQDLQTLLASARQGSLLREGLHVVLAGQPNVGKSSLLNQLAGEDLAIVTDVPGTTRDSIRQLLEIDGVPVFVVDTAGLRETSDPVEKLGVDRAWTLIRRADVVMILVDASTGVTAADDTILLGIPAATPRITVMNKIDLMNIPASAKETSEGAVVWLSALTGEGMPLLKSALLRSAGWEGHAETAFLARERHLQALHAAAAHMEEAACRVGDAELVAEELRLAQRALSSITGEFSADDLLGEIFSRFCIGK